MRAICLASVRWPVSKKIALPFGAHEIVFAKEFATKLACRASTVRGRGDHDIRERFGSGREIRQPLAIG